MCGKIKNVQAIATLTHLSEQSLFVFLHNISGNGGPEIPFANEGGNFWFSLPLFLHLKNSNRTSQNYRNGRSVFSE
ncbi:hypothetical protein SLEP1_g39184 [Rubroshorea leprosula]|uniref:Uncharacterized protein n=1 Tax=Rubroshorea leprosula TaxID=152421 RepID=A0AAV5KZE1_9ROSI|nr:hypothetical protein SLEP1_g39184 [Rubroshorea leprosula]